MTSAGLSAAPSGPQAEGPLSELRSRLDYVARKSTEAAEHVLDAVDKARAEQPQVRAALQELRAAAVGTNLQPAVDRLATLIEASSGRTDEQLTDILLAQGFHDLIGQVLVKAGHLVNRLEQDMGPRPDRALSGPGTEGSAASGLAGPVLDAAGGDAVLTDQDEVDALLAKTGF